MSSNCKLSVSLKEFRKLSETGAFKTRAEEQLSEELASDGDRRARLQSCDEWITEYETGKPVIPTNVFNRRLNTDASPKLVLRYDHHRTAKSYKGAVVLSFFDSNEYEYVKFFNVDLDHQRGPKKGTQRKIGVGGQFLPPRRGEFRKWYVRVVGSEPKRWATVHKELKARLKATSFTGVFETATDSAGRRFFRLKNVEVLEEQISHKKGTTVEQFSDTPF